MYTRRQCTTRRIARPSVQQWLFEEAREQYLEKREAERESERNERKKHTKHKLRIINDNNNHNKRVDTLSPLWNVFYYGQRE